MSQEISPIRGRNRWLAPAATGGANADGLADLD